MNAKPESKKANQKSDWHPAEVIAALKMRGTSLRQLSISSGYRPGSLRNALDRKWPKAERIIASALGKQPEEIWPNRYSKHPFRL